MAFTAFEWIARGMPRSRPPLSSPLRLRSERAWNTFDRWLQKHPRIRRLELLLARTHTWQVTRRSHGNTGEPGGGSTTMVQTAGGGSTHGAGVDYTQLDDDVPCLEQQGFASGVGEGARGLVIGGIGGAPGNAAGVGLRQLAQRPDYVDDAGWECCVYQPAGSRLYMTKAGEVRCEAGLADYQADAADHDEGSKLRLNKAGEQGAVELYGEALVEVRSSPKGGGPTSARIQVESDGRITITSNTPGASSTVTLEGSTVTVEADTVYLGAAGAALTDPVALATVARAELQKLVTALKSVVIVPQDGGATLTAAVELAFPGPVADFGADGVRAKK